MNEENTSGGGLQQWALLPGFAEATYHVQKACVLNGEGDRERTD